MVSNHQRDHQMEATLIYLLCFFLFLLADFQMHFRVETHQRGAAARKQMFSWETMLINAEDCFTSFRKKKLFVIDWFSQIKCLTSTCGSFIMNNRFALNIPPGHCGIVILYFCSVRS